MTTCASKMSRAFVAIALIGALSGTSAYLLAEPAFGGCAAYANNSGTDDYYHVNDYTGTLSEDEEYELSEEARALEVEYSFDFEALLIDYDEDAYDLAQEFFTESDLGYGSSNEGIILCLKPSDGTAGVYYDPGSHAAYFSESDLNALAENAKSDFASKGAYEAVENFLASTSSVVASAGGSAAGSGEAGAAAAADNATANASTDSAASEGSSFSSVSSARNAAMAGSASSGSSSSSSGSAASSSSSSDSAASSSSSSSSSTHSTSTSSKKTTADLSWYPSNPSTFTDFHNEDAPRVIDNAGILSADTEAELTTKLTDMKNRLNMDFVVVTDTSSYGLSRDVFAADYFQFNGYGVGSDYSGVIFFVCMEEGNRGFTTIARGSARTLLTEDNLNYMDDRSYDYFSDGNYDEGVKTQVNNLDVLYTNGEFPADLTFVWVDLAIALAIGAVGGFFGLNAKKARMRTVAQAVEARNYLEHDSVDWRVKEDIYLTSTFVRTKIEHDDDHGGGSSFSGGFSGSGGGSFSGGGRSF